MTAVITGMGAVTPHGIGVDALWDGLVSGRSTAGPITLFDPVGYPSTFACEVPNFVPSRWLPSKVMRQTDRFAQFALIAAHEALLQAGLVGDSPLGRLQGVEAERVAVIVASSIGGISTMSVQHQRLLHQGPSKVSPYLAVAMPLNLAGGQIAIRYGARGQVVSPVSACASAADALLQAGDLFRLDRADVVIAGGAEASITPLTIAGFGGAGALSRRNDDPAAASRPFDLGRDGFVMGEGAGILVLERAEHAQGRQATVLAELAGSGAANDAYHPSAPSPDGQGAIHALQLAMADAGITPQDVGHVNSHGTSTAANDRVEAQAVRAVLGAVAGEVPVTSNKSSIGHLLGAAGAVEAIATVKSLQDGVIPPTLNLTDQDPDCGVQVVTDTPLHHRADIALSNSFGFGGHNVVLALRSPRYRKGRQNQ